jgi:hypothetical protein
MSLFDYTGSFSGSFTGDLTSTNGVISSSAQVDYTLITRKPTTITPFQASSIIANTHFRENTFFNTSASIANDINNARQILTLSGRTLSISFGNSVILPEGNSSGGESLFLTGSYAPTSESLASGSFDFYFTQNNLVITGSLSVTRPITGSLFGTADTASYVSDSFISASAVRSGFISNIQISGSTLEGGNINGQFKTIIFNSSAGLHVTTSNATTALISFTLDTSSAHFINAVNDLGLFRVTGSVYSTTNNLEITGSLEVNGLVKLTEFSSLPTAEGGAIAYSSSAFWFGFD